MEELKGENPKYKDIEVTIIEEKEQAELANQYDYFYVPAYYVDGIKVHEGAATKDIIRKIFEKSINT